MPRKQLCQTPDARREALAVALETTYSAVFDAAAAYLAVTESAPDERERIALLERILLHHGLPPFSRNRKSSVRARRNLGHLVSRLSPTVCSWINEIQLRRLPAREAAEILWPRLILYEGTERVVALAMILTRLSPYALVPLEYLIVGTEATYEDARQRAHPALALTACILKGGGSELQVAAGIVHVLDSIGDLDERVVVMEDLMAALYSKEPPPPGEFRVKFTNIPKAWWKKAFQAIRDLGRERRHRRSW